MKKITKKMKDFLRKQTLYEKEGTFGSLVHYQADKIPERYLYIGGLDDEIRILYIYSKKAISYRFKCNDCEYLAKIIDSFNIDLTSKEGLEFLKQNYTYTKRKYNVDIVKQIMEACNDK